MHESNMSYIRRLNPMEEALTITGNAFPLCVMCVLHVTNGPDEAQLRVALTALERRHPLLTSSIERHKGGYWFCKPTRENSIPCKVVKAGDIHTWQQVATSAINTPLPATGPLMRCWLVRNDGTPHSELIVCFHHAIVDAVSCRLLLHELLSLCNTVPLPPAPAFSTAGTTAPATGNANAFGFVAGMLMREWKYRRHGIKQTIPAQSENGLISIHLTAAVSRSLAVAASRLGLTVNAVLMAALARAVLRHQYPGNKKALARLVSFVDLRENAGTAVQAEPLSCQVSMLPFDALCPPDEPATVLAAHIQKAIYTAGRRGDAVHLYHLARYLMRIMLKTQHARLGITALSFMGKLDLQPAYGDMTLREVSAFIPTNRLGPGFSAFAKTLFGALGLHITYLTAEISSDLAKSMAQQIREDLENMAKKA